MRIERLEPRCLLTAQPLISEWMANSNGALLDGDGNESDWIELYNAGDEAIDLARWHLTDDAQTLNKWTFPSDRPDLTVLAPGQFMIVFASGERPVSNYVDAGGNLHVSFRLDSNGEYLALVRPSDEGVGPRADDVVSQFGTAETNYPPQLPGISFGLPGEAQTVELVGPRSSTRWLVPQDNQDANLWTGAHEPFNDSDWNLGFAAIGYEVEPATDLLAYWDFDNQATDEVAGRVAEVNGAQFVDDYPPAIGAGQSLVFDGTDDFVELTPFVDDFAQLETGTISAWFKSSTPRAQAIVAASDTNDRGHDLNLLTKFGSLQFDVRGDVASGGTLISSSTESRAVNNDRWRHAAITVDQRQQAVLYLDGRRVAARPQAFFSVVHDLNQMAIGRDVQVRGEELWFEGGIDDVAIWGEALTSTQIAQLAEGVSPTELSGVSGVIESDIQDAVFSNSSSLYLRTAFELSELDANTLANARGLQLATQYNDGFVAYLNGEEVARRNAPQQLSFASQASSSIDAAFEFASIDLSQHLDLLRIDQPNQLAVHLLNEDASDRDLLFSPQLKLTSFQFENDGAQYFPSATPRAFNGSGVLGVFESAPSPSVSRGTYIRSDLQAGGRLAAGVSFREHAAEARIAYTTDGRAPVIAADGTIEHGSLLEPDSSIMIDRTTTIRAVTFAPGYLTSPVSTHSYVVLDDVLSQDNESLDPLDYPADWGNHIEGDEAPAIVLADYAMDPEVVNDPRYADTWIDDLRSLPSMSIVMDPDDLFGEARGIYANPFARGSETERGASVELILADGTSAFQADAGIRIHGGASRRPRTTSKHSFRLEFKAEYGDTKLRYPLFGESGTDEIDAVVLRGGYNDSWPMGTNNATYIRDQLMRDLQREMGQPSGNGIWVHLYLNGIYWGLYNPSERPASDFQATYLGGEKESYDVVNHNGLQSGVADGWNRAQQIAAGGLESVEDYEAFQEYVNVESLADYMLLNIFAGTLDWPGNNWYAARQREPQGSFRFFVWDAEQSFKGVAIDQTGADAANSPAFLFAKARQNADFRTLFADRVQRHLAEDGTLDAENVLANYHRIRDEVERAIRTESARWGDSKREPAFTLDDNWLPSINRIDLEFLQARTEQVLEQLDEAELRSSLPAPTFSHPGGEVELGFNLELESFDVPMSEDTVMIDEGHPVQYLLPSDAADDLTWYQPGFETDGGWFTGTVGLGYDNPNTVGLNPAIQTDITSAWSAQPTSVYMRLAFEADTARLADADELLLRMKYDDGFVAYLNGVEVARSVETPDGQPAFNTVTGVSRSDAESLQFIDFDLRDFRELIRDQADGPNLLAIHALNRSDRDRDLLILPRLVARKSLGIFPAPIYFTLDGSDPRAGGEAGDSLSETARLYSQPIPINSSTSVRARIRLDNRWSALQEAAYVPAAIPATSDTLRITEIHFNPAEPNLAEFAAGFSDNNDFEFIELMNIGTSAIDLIDVRLRQQDEDGVAFEFEQSAITRLEPQARLVVTEDIDAFRFRYGTDIPVAGQWTGGLGNREELIWLEAQNGTIHRFTYSDEWHVETDGLGAALEFLDPLRPDLVAWSIGTNWQGSKTPGGSPGFAAANHLPGDANRDGLFDSLDLIQIFQAGEYEDTFVHNSSWTEGDWNRDGEFTTADIVLAFQLNGGGRGKDEG